MLDLGATRAYAHNPIILELAAVHFNIDTGKELDAFTRIMNYDSCKARGLNAEDPETEAFLKGNKVLKRTLDLSESSTISLEDAFSDFSAFIDKAKEKTLQLSPRSGRVEKIQTKIWGNGAASDSV